MQQTHRRHDISPAQFAFARAVVQRYMFHAGQRLPRTRINLIARRLLRTLPKRIVRRFHRDTLSVTMRRVRDVLRSLFLDPSVACR